MSINKPVKPYTFTDGAGNIAYGSQVNADFDIIYNKTSDIIEAVNAASGTRASLDTRLSVALNADGTLRSNVTAGGEWLNPDYTATYVSTSSFTVDSDLTAIFYAARRLRLNDTIETTVSTSSYSAGADKTTVNTATSVVPTTITKLEIGLLIELGNIKNGVASIATLTGSQTLTNKTLTTPVINGFTGDTSVINIGSGQIYKDVNGDVGIGITPSGSYKLEVNGSGYFSGNVGIGVTPNAWSLPAIESQYGLFSGRSEVNIAKNAYFNGGWKYITSSTATRYTQTAQEHQFYLAASGVAGEAITFFQGMSLSSTGLSVNGNLLVGTTTDDGVNKLQVNGSGSFSGTVVTGGDIVSSKANDCFVYNYAGGSPGTVRAGVNINGTSQQLQLYAANLTIATISSTGLSVTGDIAFTPSTTTTAPAAGGAGALPATPLGYATITINGTARKIAYYA